LSFLIATVDSPFQKSGEKGDMCGFTFILRIWVELQHLRDEIGILVTSGFLQSSVVAKSLAEGS
jgi:hypothetical protein